MLFLPLFLSFPLRFRRSVALPLFSLLEGFNYSIQQKRETCEESNTCWLPCYCFDSFSNSVWNRNILVYASLFTRSVCVCVCRLVSFKSGQRKMVLVSIKRTSVSQLGQNPSGIHSRSSIFGIKYGIELRTELRIFSWPLGKSMHVSHANLSNFDGGVSAFFCTRLHL